MTITFDDAKELNAVPEEILRKAARVSLSAGLRVKFATPITSNNFIRVDEYCERALGLGASGLKFYRYMQIGNASLGPSFELSAKQEKEFFALFEKARQKYPKEILEIYLSGGFSPRPGSRNESLALQSQFCPAGVMLFTMTPDNLVYGCPFLIEKGNEIGILKKEGIFLFEEPSKAGREKCIVSGQKI